MLCAIALAAVVLVHKESAGTHADELVVGTVPESAVDDEIMLVQHPQDQAAKLKHLRRSAQNAHRLHPKRGSTREPWRRAVQRGESIHLEVVPSEPTTAVPPQIEEENPVVDDTLAPVHASLRTGHVEHYGTAGFDSQAVSAASSKAAEALKDGLSTSKAFEKAQEAATEVVVGDSAANAESPAFSRTIRAAAYAAELNALKQLESGESDDVAQKAAHDAAAGMVHDERAVEISVPVPNTLGELLNNVEHMWGKMQSHLEQLKPMVQSIPEEQCEEAKHRAAASQHQMQLAVTAAQEHIAKGQEHQIAMDAQLLQADAHDTLVTTLLQDPNTAPAKLDAVRAKSSLSKQASAEHHEHAKRQAQLAEGFLSLAAKHHSAATDAATQCRAQHLIAKFGYAEQQLEAYDANAAAEAKEKAQKDEERKQLEEAASQNESLVAKMEVSLSQEMTAAAQKAAMEVLKAYHGGEAVSTATKAAESACQATMKQASKSLAASMSAVATQHGGNPEEAMKRAILTVLKVGRPLQPGIVSMAVDRATKHLKDAMEAKTFRPMATHRESMVTGAHTISVPPMPQPNQDTAAEARKAQAAKEALKEKTEQVQADVDKKSSQENTHKKVLAIKQKIALKSTKEAAEKKKADATNKAAEQAKQEKKTEEAAAAVEAQQQKAETEVPTEAEAKARTTAESVAADKVLVSAKQAVHQATGSMTVQDAAEAMSTSVTAITAKAAEEAQQKVAAAGGSVQEQLKAAAAAAVEASRRAAAAEASKLSTTAKQVARGLVVQAAEKQSVQGAEEVANIDHDIMKKHMAHHEAKDSKAASPKAASVKAVGQKTASVKAESSKAEGLTVDLLQTSAQASTESGAGSMQVAMETTVRTAMGALAAAHVSDPERMKNVISDALQPVMTKEINKSASLAAAAAGKKAIAGGLDKKAVQLRIVKAAQHEAQRAKAQGMLLASNAIKKVVQNGQSVPVAP